MNITSRNRSGNGSRSRTGCLVCRSRKRRCDEKKPACLKCQKAGTPCVYPNPLDAPRVRFIISEASEHPVLPVEGPVGTDFINLFSSDVPKVCPQYQNPSNQAWDDTDGEFPEFRLSRVSSIDSIGSPGVCYIATETQLVQYYFEVVSNSRVYIPTDRNLFRATVMPVLFRDRGPLLLTVLAMSAAEISNIMLSGGIDYHSLALTYKTQALARLQECLEDVYRAEENLLTCLLQASLEIACGSRPTWLRHLRGALAILRSFGIAISPQAANFVLQYFRFRYTIMKTTEQASGLQQSTLDLDNSELQILSSSSYQTGNTASLAEQESEQIVDEHIGCSMEMVNLIYKMSELAATQPFSDEIESHFQTTALALQRSVHDIQFITRGLEGGYLLKSAECFKIAGQIYLQLVCFNYSIVHLSVLELQEELLDALRQVIFEGQRRRSFPMWPLFIAGCACSNDEQRKSVLGFFTTLESQWPISNIPIVWRVVWTIWQNRDLCMRMPAHQQRDWQEIISKFGWKLSLS